MPLLSVSPLFCPYLRLPVFLLFVIWSGLLRFLYAPLPFLSLRLLHPTAVPGFPVSPLGYYVLPLSPASGVGGCFPCFLYGFFLLSFLLGASRLRSPGGVSVPIYSPSVGFALVLFAPCVLFFLSSQATPTSVPDSVFACWLFRIFFVIHRCTFIDIGFAFSFLSNNTLPEHIHGTILCPPKLPVTTA